MMGVSSLGSWRRRAGVALLVLGAATASAGAQPGGVVFVDDAPAPAAEPRLPSLAPPARSIDRRYLTGPVNRPAPTAGIRTRTSAPSAPTRSGFADTVSRRLQEQQGAEPAPRRSFFARLMPKFGRGGSGDEAAKTPSDPAPSFTAGPTARPAGGVELAGYYDEQRGKVIRETPGGRQHTGLFSFGGKSKPRSTGRGSSPSRQRRTARSSTPSAPRKFAGEAIAKRESRAEPSVRKLPVNPYTTAPPETDRGVVFVDDEPGQVAAESKNRLPRPQLLPESLRGPRDSQTAAADSATGGATATGPLPVVINGPDPAVGAGDERVAATPTPPAEAAKPAPTMALNPAPRKPADNAPSPRAVGLLVEANAQAQTAGDYEQFTNIIQRCRHVLAIDSTPDVVRYSRELASWALNKRGELLADTGRDAEAMTDFEDALRMDRRRWRAIHNRAVLMAQAGDFAEAFDAFNETIEQNPEFAKAYSNRASLFVQAGDFAAAMDDYSQAIALDPDLAIAHKGRGRVCHMIGQMEQALRHFDAAVLLAPEDATVVNCRADLLVDMGRYAAATESYEQAIALDAEMPAAYRNLAWLQATCPDAGYLDAAQAVANAERALELAGEADDISLDTLAAALAASGDFESAVGTIKRAIELAPAGDQPIYSSRLSLYEAGKPFSSQPVAPVQQAGFSREVR